MPRIAIQLVSDFYADPFSTAEEALALARRLECAVLLPVTASYSISIDPALWPNVHEIADQISTARDRDVAETGGGPTRTA